MKRLLILGITLLTLCLTGCTRYPSQADDGRAWEQSWEMLGSSLGVEVPDLGYRLLENNVVLAADDTYYATWVSGEPSPWVNAAGKDVELYPAQLYLLYYGCADAAAAREAMADWMARERESYTVRETRDVEIGGQTYTVLYYDCGSPTNPYSRGASAFGVFHRFVVAAELTCTAEYGGDEAAELEAFLQGFHYSSAAMK